MGLRDFKCGPGLQDDSLLVMKTKLMDSKSPLEKLGVICLDEMDVKFRYEFDTRQQKVYTPCQKTPDANCSWIDPSVEATNLL